MEHKFEALPPTARWRTPSGGEQILFWTGIHRIPKSVATLGKRAGELASGLDVIAIGAMTVLPGSERPDGSVEWLTGFSPDEVEIAVLPDWLAKLMLEAGTEYRTKRSHERSSSTFAWRADCDGISSRRAEMWLRKAIEGKAKDVSGAPNGAQERTLNGQAWHLGTKIASLRERGFQIPKELAEEGRRALIGAGLSMTNHDPRWSWLPYEVEEKVNDALQSGLQHPFATLPAELWPDPPSSASGSKTSNIPPRGEDPPEPGSFEPGADASPGAEAPNAELPEGKQSDDEPEPLLPEIERAAAFPLDALGTVIGDAAKALVQLTQAPEAVAGQTILAALNVVAQRHIDVLVPQGGDNPHVGSTQPVSCFFLTVARTGERKSSCEKIALKEHRDYERNAWRIYEVELEKFAREKAVWDAKKKRILSDRKKGVDPDEQLKQLGPEPKQPPDPTFIFDNPTWPGLVKKLRYNARDVGLISDDAGKVLGGHSMGRDHRQATAANMNSAWDGKPMQRILAGEEAFILNNVRLSMHLMAQPMAAETLLSDDNLHDQGFLARFLVSAPDPREKARSWTPAEKWAGPCIAEYDKTVRDMLQMPVGQREFWRGRAAPALSLARGFRAAYAAVQ